MYGDLSEAKYLRSRSVQTLNGACAEALFSAPDLEDSSSVLVPEFCYYVNGRRDMSDSEDAGLDLDSVFTVSDSSLCLAPVCEKRAKVRSHQGHHHLNPRSQHTEEKVETAQRKETGLRSPFASLARIRCGDTICTQYPTPALSAERY